MEETLKNLVNSIEAINKRKQRLFLINQYKLSKPVGSLGKLDDIAYRISGINDYYDNDGELVKTIFVLAGDHGISREGVSLYESSVTTKVLQLINNEKAPINVIANHNSAKLVLADMGVIGKTTHLSNVLNLKVRNGTANYVHQPAMTREEAIIAICRGASLIEVLDLNKKNVIAVGEIGIGNTTASSIITSYMCNVSINKTIGYGTGISEEAFKKKALIAKKSMELHKLENSFEPLELLRTFGGFEMAGVVGLLLAASSKRIPILIDGFITSAAASIAVCINEYVRDYLFASHLSAEPGHKFLLQFLKLDPLLNLGMKLGMASGAAISLPLFETGYKIASNIGEISDMGLTKKEKIY